MFYLKTQRHKLCYLGNVLMITNDGVVKRSQPEIKYIQLSSPFTF